MAREADAWIAKLNVLNRALLHEDIPKSLEKKIKKAEIYKTQTPEQFFEHIKRAKEQSNGS